MSPPASTPADYSMLQRVFNQAVGRNLRTARLLTNCPLCELARRSGVSETTIRLYECGGEAELEDVCALAEALGIDAVALLPKLR